MTELKETLHELESTESMQSKIENYSALKTYLESAPALDENTETRLLQCLASDINIDNEPLQLRVLLIWGVLLKDDQSRFLSKVPVSLFKIACNADDKSKQLHTAAQIILEIILKSFIKVENLNDMPILDIATYGTIAVSVKKLTKDFPPQELSRILHVKIIPKLYDKLTNSHLRGFLYECALDIIEKVSISLLTQESLVDFKKKVEELYLPQTEALRQMQDDNWYKLCIFFMRYFGKLLHKEINLTNALLQIVESGFRTKTVFDKSVAYDCWKELINNYGLDKKYLQGARQIKLLVKPLKIKLSKHEQVVRKRYDVWAHLILLLQDRSEVCLDEFLQFCFGPLGENKDENCERILHPGRMMRELWPKSTEMLLNLLGHACVSSACLQREHYSFEKPVINETNFLGLHNSVVGSTVECCMLLLSWELTERIESITKCLWTSLLRNIFTVEDGSKIDVLKALSFHLALSVQRCHQWADYFDYVLKPLMEVVLSFDNICFEGPVLNEFLLVPLIKGFLDQYDTMTLSRRNTLLEFFKYSSTLEDKKKFFRKICHTFNFKSSKTKECQLSLDIWYHLGDVLSQLLNGEEEQHSAEFESDCSKFLLWLVMNYRHSSDFEQNTLNRWKLLLRSSCKIHVNQRSELLRQITKIANENPELSNNLVHFVQSFEIFVNKSCSKQFTSLVVSAILQILSIPCLNDVAALVPLIELVIQHSLDDNNLVHNILNSMQSFLQPHKTYAVLPLLLDYVQKGPNVKSKMPNSLLNLLKKLSTHDDTKLAQDATKLLSYVDKTSEKKFSTPFMSRSAKIAQMGKNNLSMSPKSSALTLFGLNVDGTSPHRIRGSPLNNKSPNYVSKSPKAANAMPAFSKPHPKPEDDDIGKYVVINEEYKFQPGKLSEHQKEVMKKRRDNIPALYQDLSQSLSNTYDAMNSSSNTNSEETEKPAFSNHENKNIDIINMNPPSNTKTSQTSFVENLSLLTSNENIEKMLVNGDDESRNCNVVISSNTTKGKCIRKLNLLHADTENCDKRYSKIDKVETILDKETAEGIHLLHAKTEETIDISLFINNEETAKSICEKYDKVTDPKSESKSVLLLAKEKESSETELNGIEDENALVNDSETTNDKSAEKYFSFHTKDQENSEELKNISNEYINSIDTTCKTSVIISDSFKIISKENNDNLQKINEVENCGKIKSIEEETFETANENSVTNKNKESDDNYQPIDNVEHIVVDVEKKKNVITNGKSRRKTVAVKSKSINRKIPKKNSEISIKKSTKQVDLSSANSKENNQVNMINKDENIKPVAKRKRKIINGKLIQKAVSLQTKPKENNGNIQKNAEAIIVPNAIHTLENNSIENEESIMKSVPVIISKIQKRKRLLSNEEVIDFKRQNISSYTITDSDETQIENVMNTESESSVKRFDTEQALISNEPNLIKTKKVLVQNKLNVQINKLHSSPAQAAAARRAKNLKIEKELRRIKMDIVGGEEFQKNLLRPSSLKKNMSLRSGKNSAETRKTNTFSPSTKSRYSSLKLVPNVKKLSANNSQLDNDKHLKETAHSEDTSISPKRERRKSLPARLKNIDTGDCVKVAENTLKSVLPSTNLRNNANINGESDSTKSDLRNNSLSVFDFHSDDTFEDTANKINDDTEKDNEGFQESENLLNRRENEKFELHLDTAISQDVIESSQESFVEIVPYNNQSTGIDNEKLETMSVFKTAEYGVSKQVIADNEEPNAPLVIVTPENVSSPLKLSPDTSKIVGGNNVSISNISSDSDMFDCLDNVEKPLCERDTVTMKIEENASVYYQNADTVSFKTDVEAADFSYKDADTFSLKAEGVTNLGLETDYIENCLLGEVKQACDTDVAVCDMDTLTEKESPAKSLPSSPVTTDTPVRTSELLDNTFDISPIKSPDESSSKLAPINLFGAGGSNANDDFPQTMLENEDVADTKENEIKTRHNQISCLKQPSSRLAKLLNLLPNSLHLNFKSKATDTPKALIAAISSPKTDRIRKMMLNYEHGNNSKDKDDEENQVISDKDLFTFCKDIPSSLAVPKSSILKRKAADTLDEGVSPCAKRKRVNFCDPPTTSKKIFFIDKNVHMKLTSLKTDEALEDADGVSREDLKPTNQTAEEIVGIPIFPELVNCKDSVHNILKYISNQQARFPKNVIRAFRTKNIVTIGDIAALSKSEISKMPLKIPKVATVLNALRKYAVRIDINNEIEFECKENTVVLSPTDLRKDIVKVNNLFEPKFMFADANKACALESTEGTLVSNGVGVSKHAEKNTDDINATEVRELLRRVKSYNLPQDKLCELIMEIFEPNTMENFLNKVKTEG